MPRRMSIPTVADDDVDPVWVYEYANGAQAQVRLFRAPVADVHPTDRIEFSVWTAEDADDAPTVCLLMHTLEAVDIISMLSHAVSEAIVLDLPLASTD